MTRRAVALLYAASLLAGCATEEWIYEKPGMTPAKLDHDIAVCRREAPDPRSVVAPGSERVDRALFNRCMERKGYTGRTVKP
ncbi:MAG: hypothetical protein E6G61_07340 [Actinobacteria bacterium]|nr:MAG: hypothetical protein E6G61_07340 [Actinomycetota bacterium]